jgi:5-formyltetrahydrofolate cyclo-ligase
MSSRTELRQKIRSRRNSLSSLEQKEAALNLQQILSRHSKVIQAKNIAIYLANDGELDTSPFIQWCWQQGKKVYLPVIHPFSAGNLLFLHYRADTNMVTNCYGILEPKLDVRSILPIPQIDVLFTPLVAFDKQGNRLGMGGGFYDRTLANWFHQSQLMSMESITPYPIGLAHHCQQVQSIPCQHWDVPLPEIVTPLG